MWGGIPNQGCQLGFSISQAAPDQSGKHLRPAEDQALQRLVLVLSGRPLRLGRMSSLKVIFRAALSPLPLQVEREQPPSTDSANCTTLFHLTAVATLTLPSTLKYHHLWAGASQDGHFSLTQMERRLQHCHHENYSATSWNPKQSLSYHKDSR